MDFQTRLCRIKELFRVTIVSFSFIYQQNICISILLSLNYSLDAAVNDLSSISGESSR